VSEERWELLEVFDGEQQVVGRYTDEDRARKACAAVLLAGRPTEPGDSWDESDYFVRRAARMTSHAPCKTCSRLCRANRVRCTVCGFWRTP
jgi:hypothetical protein